MVTGVRPDNPVNMRMTVHIFRHSFLEDIHSVAPGHSHESDRNSYVRNGKKELER